MIFLLFSRRNEDLLELSLQLEHTSNLVSLKRRGVVIDDGCFFLNKATGICLNFLARVVEGGFSPVHRLLNLFFLLFFAGHNCNIASFFFAWAFYSLTSGAFHETFEIPPFHTLWTKPCGHKSFILKSLVHSLLGWHEAAH